MYDFGKAVNSARPAPSRKATLGAPPTLPRLRRLRFEPLEVRRVLSGDSTVVFNEIMYHPADGEELEWLELHNQMAVDMDLSGWKLDGAVDYEFSDGTIVPGGGYLVVAAEPVQLAAATGFADAVGPYDGRLSNGGEQITLQSNSGRVMDVVDYDDRGLWPVSPDGSGASLAKIAPRAGSQSAENWTSSDRIDGTPGQPNGLLPELVLADSIWRYLDDGSNQGSAWYESGFDDSGWDAGAAELGYGDGDEATVVDYGPDAGDKYITTYFRHTFSSLLDPSQLDGLTVELLRDDGAVIYLNGQELGRSNMPDGDVDYLTPAFGGTSGDEESTFYSIPGNPDLLLWGSNVIAVELHQRSGNSTDTSFNLRLVGQTRQGNRARSPLVFNEVASAGEAAFWLELANFGDAPLPLDGYVIAASTGSEYVLPAQLLGPGEFLVVTEAQLQFHPAVEDALFLYAPGRSAVLDGVRVEALLQGRWPDGTGRWLYPDVATPEALNSFALHDEIVINEIMYHHRPTLETSPGVTTTEAVAIAATWSYEQSGVFPGAAWNSLGFNDSGWSSGDGIFFAGPFSGQADPTLTAIPTLFGTGLNAAGQVVADGQPDPHYLLTGSAHGEPPPPDVPATVIANHPAWLANNGSSKWLGPVNPGTTSVAEGDYSYETSFDLTGFVPGSVTVSMNLAVDDSLTDVLINGVGTGITHAGFGGLSPTRTIDAGFVDGVNTLTFLVNNGGAAPNPAGFRVELGGTALPIPANTELDLGPTTYYFRTDFQFGGDPASTELELTPFVDDGAVFYLNGVEVYRHNMPIGQILNTTLAGVEVAGEATFGEPVAIPSNALVSGVNVLAVEVHQAAGGFDDAAFGAALQATETLVEGSPFVDDPEEWIELTNRSGATVDLSGWSFDDGIRYQFESGTTIAPGAFLVVAKDAGALQQKYPAIDVVGNYSRRLSNSSDRVVLLDDHGNPADEVHYYEGGRWPEFADGGGSSLELRDPRADNSAAEAWAASDETGKSSWQTITYRGVAGDPPGSNNPAGFHEFVFGLLDAGEILIDDISVVEDPDGTHVELIQNGSFTAGTGTWRLLGNHADHGQTRVVADPEDAANMVLHVVATGATEHMHNHLETTLAGGRTVVDGREYEISFRARWLTGSNQVNTRLYFNRLARTTVLSVPQDNGTPGALNSQSEANIGPTYDDLRHGPVMPEPGEEVIVSVVAADADGLAAVDPMILRYSVDGGAFVDVTMSEHKAATGGRALLLGATTGRGFVGVIPGHGAGAVVQFYVEGRDGLGETSTFPAAGPGSRALYVVDDGLAGGGPQHDFRLIMTAEDAAFQFDGPGNTNGLSNHRLGATVVFMGSDVYYDVGVRMKGSGYSRGSARTGYNVKFHAEQLFRGVHNAVSVDRTASSDGRGPGASHKEMVLKHIATRAGDIPGMYDDLIYFIPPSDNIAPSTAQLLMARYDDAFLDGSFANGSDGTRYKFELIYYPPGTIDGNPESFKSRPSVFPPRDVEIRDLGDDKEAYRWNFLTKNQRARDDYSGIIEMGKAFSLSGSSNGSQLDLRSQEAIDVDQWLRMFAYESLGGVADTYNQGFAHNIQFFVRPEDGRVVALPWDQDFAFHQSTTMSLFGTGSNFRKIINIPNNKHYFYGHLHDIINTTFNATYLSDWIDHYAAFAEFNDSSEILSYVNARRTYVLGQLPGQVGFAVTTNNGAPFTVDERAVSIKGDGWINVREIRLQGSSDPLDVTWTDVDSWQLTLPIGPGENLLTFQAFDFQGNLLSGDSITVTSTATAGPLEEFLRITELNYNPADPTADETARGFDNNDDFEFVELQNIGTESIDLTGAHFTNGIDYTFSAGSSESGVLITEVSNEGPDYVEIQNVSENAVSTSGWVVAINDSTEFQINDVYPAQWHLPDSVNAGEVLYSTNDPGDNYWGEEFEWRTQGPGWVMVVDQSGGVVDFMVWGYLQSQIESLDVTIGGHHVTAGGFWTGDSIPREGSSNNSAQRSGNSDNHDASEWAFVTPQSKGTTNANLVLPFVGDGFQLGPGQFVVLAKNPLAVADRYGSDVETAGPYLNKLSNGGERLRLVDSTGAAVFDFRYDDEDGWPGRADGKGASLEIIDPAAVPDDAADRTVYLDDPDNWRSGVAYLGTPGTLPQPHQGVVINEVLSHTDWPQVDSIELHNVTDQPIDVGGWYLSDRWGWDPLVVGGSSGSYKKFRIPADLPAETTIPPHAYLVFDERDFNPTPLSPAPNHFALDGADGDDVWLMRADAAGNLTHFGDHVDFGAQANGESWGRWPDAWVPSPEARGAFYPMTTLTLGEENSGPRLGAVLISEVHYNPGTMAEADDLEFVEIYNASAAAVDLTHWRLRKGVDFNFAPGDLLAPETAMVIVPFDPVLEPAKMAAFRTAHNIQGSIEIRGPYSGKLHDDGESVQLRYPDEPPPEDPNFYPGLLADEVIYDDDGPWPTAADGSGAALHRRSIGAWGDDGASWIAAATTPGIASFDTVVLGRHVFYNGSTFDWDLSADTNGNGQFDPGEDGPNDNAAVATDKVPLLDGGVATLANYTSYSRGINGVIIDLANLPAGKTPVAGDFRFHVGNDDTPGDWPAAADPSSVTFVASAGTGGSDRVTIVWPDGQTRNTWLQVTVLGTNLGLAGDEVFYFGNAVAESGNSPADARVTTTDLLLARNNPRNFLSPPGIVFPYDYNRDGHVNATDVLLARNNQTNFLDALKVIDLSAEEGESPQAPLADLAWLYNYEQVAPRRPAAQEDDFAIAVDKLLATY